MSSEDLNRRLRATFVNELQDQVRLLNEGLLALEQDRTDPEALRTVFRAAHTVKGSARVIGLEPIESLCHALETRFAAAREGEAELTPGDFSLLFAVVDGLGESARQLRRGGEPDEDRLFDLRLALLGEAPPPDRSAAPPTRPPPTPASTDEPEPPEPSGRAGPAPAAPEERVRVEADRLEELLDAANELILVCGRIQSQQAKWRDIAERLSRAPSSLMDPRANGVASEVIRQARLGRRNSRELNRITDEISTTVRELRMRRFGDICEGLPRAVRDIAAASGKEVRLELSGEEVRADRLVLDALREPLVQLSRNAVRHGIEPPEERERAGKTREGVLRIEAAITGGRFLVTVADDGSGIDTAALRERLQGRGQPQPADDRGLVPILLAGGVSTSQRADEISGRGVGLDIVRSALERVGGTVDIEWEPGEGTEFRLECPPSPATIRALLVCVGDHVIALPTLQIDRLVRVAASDVRVAEGRSMVAVDDRPIPLLSLGAALGPPFSPGALAGVGVAAVVSAGQKRAALLVDELLEEREIVVRPLDELRRARSKLIGGSLLPSGRVALVVAGSGLLDGVDTATSVVPVGPAEREAPRRSRVLVADDSITTRTLEQSVLEAAGYDVTTAVDGEDAWSRLRDESFDAVVSDIEMPRLDGFGLCERLRTSRRHAELPVILVTGRESEEDRARGLEAGADAYIQKSSFDQETLLSVLRELIG